MNDELKACSIPKRDGRLVGLLDVGPRDAPVWFYCHGIPGSRKECLLATAADRSLRVRLIAIDRPGYGESAPKSCYSLDDHADDILAVAEHLKISEFSLLGFSGGGVFAVATAQALGTRVRRLALVGTPCVPLLDDPFTHAGALTAEVWRAALEAPRALATRLEALTGNSDALIVALMNSVGDMERRCLDIPKVYTTFKNNMVAAVRHGDIPSAESIVRDMQLIIENWPFNPRDMSLPVEGFYGDSDELVHLAHGKALASAIDKFSLTVLPRSGHYDTLIDVFNRLGLTK